MIRKIKEAINLFLMEHMGYYFIRFPSLRRSATYAMNLMKGPLTIAEIGVDEGINSHFMLKKMDIKKLYLIDIWQQYDEYLKSEQGRTKETMTAAYKQTLKNTKGYEDKVKIIVKPSVDAVKDIPECDYIYIDANHEYDFVKKDIETYYPKVKKGGVLAGHDIAREGVLRAVAEFAKEKNLKLMTKHDDWWFVKD
jgi:hypothetical protein